MNASEIIKRNNVTIIGEGSKTLMLAHGFGCDQQMWRFLAPRLASDYRLLLFDYVGSGGSDITAFDADRYASVDGYAQDVIEIIDALELKNINMVGHSVSSNISLIASQARPDLFDRLIFICPTPRFLNSPPDYFGGFDQEDIQDLIDLMDMSYMGFANKLAPMVAGEDINSTLSQELSTSFCAIDPKAAKAFAEATFFADCRNLLPLNRHQSLIIQSRFDALAPEHVGEYMHETMPQSTLRVIEAVGHCLHMSHPREVYAAIQDFMIEA
ncbi:alpha/beta fold hydrolase [Vreelandella salicampi]|uniref:Alpha/beta hydrolase n=1 Tax=Vreelandella salicampi TaxID=1449798 RepID=A0A7Z0LN25_9GAMM|nr:alpha/beta hydrolase [Halomonas salicampi]NYS62009.1 alpha/beta hydrolase [Halomonas salicampi]